MIPATGDAAVVGVGIDLVTVSRIEAALQNHPERFARRVLSADEFVRYVERGSKARDLAKSWAVKEAASKALGTGMGAGVYWPQLELLRKATSGAPLLVLHGAALARLHHLGGSRGFVSLADEGDLVIASVVLAAAAASPMSATQESQ